MAKKMRINSIMGPTDVNGEALHFKIRDEKPTDKIYPYEAVEIFGPMSVCGGDVSGYTVVTWDSRRIEVNGSKLETVEWTEDKRDA